MTQQSTKQKKINLAPTSQPVKASAWVNLYFSTKGHSFVGCHVWPSEDEARVNAEKCIDFARSEESASHALKFNQAMPGLQAYRWIKDQTIWYGLPIENFSHVIQVPRLTP